MKTQTKYDQALDLVKTEFAYKKDKGGKPYVEHLIRVSDSVKHLGETYSVVALLHDLIEDIDGWDFEKVKKLFGKDIAFYVNILSKKKGEDYKKYIETISKYKVCKEVKLADLRDNMDLSRLPEITGSDVERVKKYNFAFSYLSK
jgi:(p)ppGpp synthase/HD superfamily hydrolase